jgi:Protein of unknown function (DUF3224)
MSSTDPPQTPFETTAMFIIDMKPAEPVLDSTGRFDFTKAWSGGVEGTGRGVMLSGGDPQQGDAGYVAFEMFEGSIDGHRGTVLFQQFGSMHAGNYALRYEIVPGSGTGDLEGILGEVDLKIDDGHHNVTLRYRI